MTLEEAIKHCEEEAKECRWKAKVWEDSDYPNEVERYLACAEKHEQLAEWLKDYKRLLEEKQNEVVRVRNNETNSLKEEKQEYLRKLYYPNHLSK